MWCLNYIVQTPRNMGPTFIFPLRKNLFETYRMIPQVLGTPSAQNKPLKIGSLRRTPAQSAPHVEGGGGGSHNFCYCHIPWSYKQKTLCLRVCSVYGLCPILRRYTLSSDLMLRRRMPIDPTSVAATASAPASVAILHRARREAKFYAGLKCCDEPGFFVPVKKPSSMKKLKTQAQLSKFRQNR